jgi:CheY-like chemotaxis protein
MDVVLIRRALQHPAMDISLFVARDGQEALDLLCGDPNHAPIQPKAVILDLQMPRMDGFHLLSAIRKQPSFQELPLIVFSSSGQESDIKETRQRGATDYVQKPMEPQRFRETVRALAQRWTQYSAPHAPQVR